MDDQDDVGLVQVSLPEEEEDWRVGSTHQRGVAREAYCFGLVSKWAAGRFSAWAGLVSRALFLFSLVLSLSLFLFLNSDLFHIFCILDQIDSNKLLKISKIQGNKIG
jgi:hypothetical protein